MVGMTGKEIYDDFTNGVGPDRLLTGAAIVNEVAANYGERAGRARRLVAKMDAAWQGEAAGAAMRGFGPVEVEHGLAGDALAVAQNLTDRQAGSFADARNGVVPVPPEPVMPPPWAMLASPSDVVSYRQQLADYNAANQHNVDVMTGYTNASVYNTNGMPRSYGVLSADQAGMVIDSGTSDPGDGGPPRGSDGGAVEWRDRGSDQGVRPPADSGGPGSPGGGAPPGGDGQVPVPQQTTPGGFTPVPGGPPARVPVDVGSVGSGPPAGGSGSGWMPGFGPVGGPGDGAGGRGPGGSGGRASGYGPEVRGPGGRAVGGEPHGPGGRLGAGPVAGGPAGEGHGGRGAAGSAGRGGPLGGMPLAGGGRPRGEEDRERRAPDYLKEDDPEGLLGTDELTAPPVIGEDEPDETEPPRAG